MTKQVNHLVRKLVYATGMDYISLGVAIDASDKSIYKWMSGKSQPDSEHLLKLIALVKEKMPFEEIFKGL